MGTGFRLLVGAALAGAGFALARRIFLGSDLQQRPVSRENLSKEEPAEADQDFPLDVASEQSFPASDPPAYMSSGRVGGPRH